MENISDLEDKSANSIWDAYVSNRIGDNRQNSQAIMDVQKLRESDKGDYELVSQFKGVPVWKSPDGNFYKYDDEGNLVPWQAS